MRLLRFLAVCGVLAAAFGSAAPAYTYKYHTGFIGAGNDAEEPQNMTVAAAKAHCSALPRCRGICYQGSNTTTDVVHVYFKSSAGAGGSSSWTTFLKQGVLRPPAKTLDVGAASQLVVTTPLGTLNHPSALKNQPPAPGGRFGNPAPWPTGEVLNPAPWPRGMV